MRNATAGLLVLGVLVLITFPMLGNSGSREQAVIASGELGYLPTARDYQIQMTPPQEEEVREPEANLPFLFAAYTVTWLAFFAYCFSLSRRHGELQREIQALHQQLEERRQPPDQ